MILKMLSVAYKELRLWLQSPANWVVVFLVPFAFIGIFGAVFKEGTPVVTIYAVNQDQGEHGAEILSLLDKSKNLDLEILATKEEADELVEKGSRMAAVVITEDFSESISTDQGASLLVIIDPGRADQAGVVTGLVQEALIKSIVYAEIERAISGLFKGKNVDGLDEDIFKTFINAGMKAVIAKSVNEAIDDPLIKVEAKPYSAEATQVTISIFNQLVPGLALVFAFFMVSHLADAVVAERSLGTLRRLMSTPLSKAALLLGKALPYFILAVLQMIFVLLVCNQLFDLPLQLFNSGRWRGLRRRLRLLVHCDHGSRGQKSHQQPPARSAICSCSHLETPIGPSLARCSNPIQDVGGGPRRGGSWM